MRGAETMILFEEEYEKIIVEDTNTGDSIAVITDESVTTASRDIVVRFVPRGN